MSITLYGHRMSQPSRAVELLLLENGIPHKLEEIDFVNGGTKDSQYLAINPNGKIPSLQDDQFVVLESHTIMRHLCRKFQLKQWYDPNSLQRCAMIDQWLDWHHLNTRTYASDMFHSIVVVNFVPMMLKSEVKWLQIDDLNRKLCESLNILNKQLKGKQYIVDDQISIVDLSIGCELSQLLAYGYNFKLMFPEVAKWLNNLQKLKYWDEVSQIAVNAGKDFLANEKNRKTIAEVRNFELSRL